MVTTAVHVAGRHLDRGGSRGRRPTLLIVMAPCARCTRAQSRSLAAQNVVRREPGRDAHGHGPDRRASCAWRPTTRSARRAHRRRPVRAARASSRASLEASSDQGPLPAGPERRRRGHRERRGPHYDVLGTSIRRTDGAGRRSTSSRAVPASAASCCATSTAATRRSSSSRAAPRRRCTAAQRDCVDQGPHQRSAAEIANRRIQRRPRLAGAVRGRDPQPLARNF